MSTPQAPAPPGRRAATVNLAGEEQERDSLLVSGDNVVPARVDGLIHNKAPDYPADAARRRVQGMVGLMIRVTESGVPAWVDVVDSSGDASLDRAAREAVSLWRFEPARNKDGPLPFDLLYNIRFTLGGAR